MLEKNGYYKNKKEVGESFGEMFLISLLVVVALYFIFSLLGGHN